jgi:hypothetical protein
LDSSATCITDIVRYLCGVLGWQFVATVTGATPQQIGFWRLGSVPEPKEATILRAAYEIHRVTQQDAGIVEAARILRVGVDRKPRPHRGFGA